MKQSKLEQANALAGEPARWDVVELDAPGAREWREIVAGEHSPWGQEGEALEWLDKQRHLGIRDGDGRLVAIAGAVVVQVQVEAQAFAVVGIGGLFVTSSARGQGLLTRIAQPLLAVAAEMGPERAMLFCRAELVRVY